MNRIEWHDEPEDGTVVAKLISEDNEVLAWQRSHSLAGALAALLVFNSRFFNVSNVVKGVTLNA